MVRRLVDFADPAEAARWRAIDDVVMGGRSASALVAAVADGRAIGAWHGVVSLDGGGFASVRRADEPVDLTAHPVLALRVRGDGRRYKLNVRTSAAFDTVVYQGGFATTGAWETVEVPLAALVPRLRGRDVAAPPLDPARVRSLGLLISERQGGAFRLELATIDAVAAAGAAP